VSVTYSPICIAGAVPAAFGVLIKCGIAAGNALTLSLLLE